MLYDAAAAADTHLYCDCLSLLSLPSTLKWFPAGSLTPETYSGGRTAADIVAFVNEKAGTNARIAVKPTHVVELTSSDFDKIVMDSSKDVLVEFYGRLRADDRQGARVTSDQSASVGLFALSLSVRFLSLLLL